MTSVNSISRKRQLAIVGIAEAWAAEDFDRLDDLLNDALKQWQPLSIFPHVIGTIIVAYSWAVGVNANLVDFGEVRQWLTTMLHETDAIYDAEGRP